MPAPNDQKIERLQTRKAQIEAELAKLRARGRVADRKADTRRKILIGAVALQEMESRADFDAWMRRLLRERLTKARDRALFDLPPLEPANDPG